MWMIVIFMVIASICIFTDAAIEFYTTPNI